MSSILLMFLACSGGDKSIDTAGTTIEDTSTADTDNTGSGSNDTDEQDTVTADGEFVDSDCVDGQYTEVWTGQSSPWAPQSLGRSTSRVTVWLPVAP